jgi:hypothetical protein
LPNPDFNTSIAGWTANHSGGIALSWNSRDSRGSSGSGSLLITNTSPTDGFGYNVFDYCVPVVAGQKYHAGGSFYFPGGQSHAGSFAIFLEFFSSADCQTGLIGQPISPLLSPEPDTWQRLDTQPAAAPAGAVAAIISIGLRKIGDGGSIVGHVDDVVLEASGSKLCYTSDERLCLASRFAVTTTWTTASDEGEGHALQLATDTGSFWFFSPTNLEMMVKALDGCPLNNKKWFFGGGLTNVKVVTTITDLSTGAQNTYTNPQGTAFRPLQDTGAFATCP